MIEYAILIVMVTFVVIHRKKKRKRKEALPQKDYAPPLHMIKLTP
jgi:hypothetical protein